MNWFKKLLDTRDEVRIGRFKLEKTSYPVPYDISKIDIYLDFQEFFKDKYGISIIYFCKVNEDRYYIEFINKKGVLVKDHIIKTYSFHGTHKASDAILKEVEYVKNSK